MEKGKLLQQKGSDHHYTAIAITGMANVIDSLEAIDECVFKKKYISMDELIDMLDHNFEGHEEKRQMLLNKAPKFGNDIEEVDQYSYWLVDVLDTEAKKYRDAMGGVFTLVIANTGLQCGTGQTDRRDARRTTGHDASRRQCISNGGNGYKRPYCSRKLSGML